jgi:glycosyltransferase involved in cell wall biosynthesis
MIRPPFDRHYVIYDSCGSVSEQCVSVVVPLYNYCSYIEECLQSVAKQEYSNIELVVIDDASTDNSIEIAEKWIRNASSRFDRVQLISHPVNRGLAFTRNTGIARASSGLVFTLDADNALYPRAISKLTAAINETGCAAAYCQIELFGDAKGIGTADIFRKAFFRRGNYVDAMALLKRQVLIDLGGYEPMGGWEDFDMWCKLLDAGLSAIFLPMILCRYRVHKSSMLQTETNRDVVEVMTQMCIRHPWLSFH